VLRPEVDVQVSPAENPRERRGGETTLVLSMREDGTLFFNRGSNRARKISAKLSSILETRGDKTLFLKIERGPPVRLGASMMDSCRRAGAPESALIKKGPACVLTSSLFQDNILT
jgi:hypothetical protein